MSAAISAVPSAAISAEFVTPSVALPLTTRAAIVALLSQTAQGLLDGTLDLARARVLTSVCSLAARLLPKEAPEADAANPPASGESSQTDAAPGAPAAATVAQLQACAAPDAALPLASFHAPVHASPSGTRHRGPAATRARRLSRRTS